MGSLQVTIDGSGSRPSNEMLGGVLPTSALVALDGFLKRLGFSGGTIAGANWCCRLPYVCREFFNGRGGSIGKNLKSVCYSIVSKNSAPATHDGLSPLENVREPQLLNDLTASRWESTGQQGQGAPNVKALMRYCTTIWIHHGFPRIWTEDDSLL